jgi:hypothetical protein
MVVAPSFDPEDHKVVVAAEQPRGYSLAAGDDLELKATGLVFAHLDVAPASGASLVGECESPIFVGVKSGEQAEELNTYTDSDDAAEARRQQGVLGTFSFVSPLFESARDLFVALVPESDSGVDCNLTLKSDGAVVSEIGRRTVEAAVVNGVGIVWVKPERDSVLVATSDAGLVSSNCGPESTPSSAGSVVFAPVPAGAECIVIIDEDSSVASGETTQVEIRLIADVDNP